MEMALPAEYRIMPQVLQEVGYQTHAVGKWDVRMVILAVRLSSHPPAWL